MKKQIRKGMFETNSSSVHALIIPKRMYEESMTIPTELYVSHGEYGWEFRRYYDANERLSYLCQGIYSGTIHNGYNERSFEERMAATEQLIRAFVKPFEDMGIEISFTPNYFNTDSDRNWYDEEGYLDHADEFMSTVYDDLKNDFEKVKRFVFGGRLVTANDNDEGMNDYLNYDVDLGDSEVIWKGN